MFSCVCFAHADPLATRLDRQLAHGTDFLAAGERWTFYSAPSTQHILLLHICSNIKSQHKECTGHVLYTKDLWVLGTRRQPGSKDTQESC